MSNEIVVPSHAEGDAQHTKVLGRENAERPFELSPEVAAKERRQHAAPDREKLRA